MNSTYPWNTGPRIGERREPGVVLLLSLVTCGIYYLWYIYKSSKEMLEFDLEPDTSAELELLFSIISCGMYTIYWDYKTAKKIVRMQEKVGIPPTDNSILYMILNFVGLGIVPCMIEQEHLNKIWHRYIQLQQSQLNQ